MKRVRILLLLAAIAALFLTGMGKSPAGTPGEPARMTVEELKAMMGDPALVILDVRKDSDWEGSGQKIAGALRADPKTPDHWAAGYDRGKTFVLYCA